MNEKEIEDLFFSKAQCVICDRNYKNCVCEIMKPLLSMAGFKALFKSDKLKEYGVEEK